MRNLTRSKLGTALVLGAVMALGVEVLPATAAETIYYDGSAPDGMWAGSVRTSMNGGRTWRSGGEFITTIQTTNLDGSLYAQAEGVSTAAQLAHGMRTSSRSRCGWRERSYPAAPGSVPMICKYFQ